MANLPKIALGAWAWGNDGTFGNNLTAESLKPIFDTAMENGLNLWDTAYAYGMGTSEKVLAGFLKGLPRESYFISDNRHTCYQSIIHIISISEDPVDILNYASVRTPVIECFCVMYSFFNRLFEKL